MVTHTRRAFLEATVLGAVGLSGCTSRAEPNCDTHRVVLKLQTKVVRIQMSRRYQSVARTLRDAFAEAGYIASVFEELDLVGSAEDIIVEVIGDVSSSSVKSRVETAGISDYDVRVVDARKSSISTVDGGVKFPWEPPTLERRASYVQQESETFGVTLPPIDASQLRVGVASDVATKVKLVKQTFAPGGRFTASLLTLDDSSDRQSKFVSTVGDDRRIADGGISVSRANDGFTLSVMTTPANHYILELLHPTRTGELPPSASEAIIIFHMDGAEILRRPLTALEQKYLTWFSDHPTEDPPNAYRDVPIVLPELDSEEALRISGALQAPTGTQNLFSRLC